MVFQITDTEGGAALNEIAENMRDQDNRFTTHPMYVVQRLKHISGHPTWLFVTIFFTEKAANEYVENHRYEDDYRVYVASGWDNREWRLIRHLLIGDNRDN